MHATGREYLKAMQGNDIKILFFIDSLMLGGMHRQVLYLVNNLDRARFDSVVCTHNSPNGGLRDEFHESGARIYDLERRKKIDPRLVFNLRKILRLEKPDIIFLTEPQNFFYFRLATLFSRHRAIQVGSFRALGFWQGHKRKYYRPVDDLLSKWMIRTSAKVVAVSSSVKDYFLQLAPGSSEKFCVIYNASDFQFRLSSSPSAVRVKHQISPDVPIVLHIAHYDPWKDFDTLLRAAKEVLKVKGNVVFLLAGEGPLRREIGGKIRKMGLTASVKLIGLQKPIYDYINAADLTVLSTHGEGFSNAILESMALGKPVVATDVGGNPELLGADGKCGFLTEPRDYLQFASRIVQLLDDPKLRSNMGREAAHRVRGLCGLKDYLDRYANLFTGVSMHHRGE